MPRQTMLVLPNATQPFWSWLTAKPLSSQLETRKALSPKFHVLMSFGLLAAGVGLCLVGYTFAIWIAYGVGFILATSGVKQLQVMICHQAAHGMVLASREANARLGTFISGLLLLKPFATYKAEHVYHHDHQTLLTDLDDTLTFLTGNVGLRPSDSVAMMWTKLIIHAFSPLALVRSIIGRVRVNLMQSDKGLAALTVTAWIASIALGFSTGFLDAMVAAWFVPVFVGYHVCTTFRLAAEHTWPPVQILRERGIAFIAESTTGVFIGEPLNIPANASKPQQSIIIALWLFRMLTLHLFIRLFIMVGDTPCHDFHHRRPRSRDWPNYITAREKDRLKGCKPYPKNYLEIWGYAAAVTNNFRAFQMAQSYYAKSNKTSLNHGVMA